MVSKELREKFFGDKLIEGVDIPHPQGPQHFILVDKTPVPTDVLTWAEQFKDTEKRRVGEDFFFDKAVRVSTIFLGLDHSFGKGLPLIFETLVFGGPLDGEMFRSSTWEDAEADHAQMVARVVKAGKGGNPE